MLADQLAQLFRRERARGDIVEAFDRLGVALIGGDKIFCQLFKLPEAVFGQLSGRDMMYEFLDRLIGITIPRIRDFRGFSAKSFDGRGNYSMGIKEQIVFPEIEYDKIDRLRGLDIVITTSARTDEEGRALLRAFQFPFK